MKAYLIIYHDNGTITRKNGITLKEAKELLNEKEFEELCSFSGIHTENVDGYIK